MKKVFLIMIFTALVNGQNVSWDAKEYVLAKNVKENSGKKIQYKYDDPDNKPSKLWVSAWRASQVAFLAANAFDAHSSWQGYENNGLLRGSDGRFSTRGILIKSAIVGGVLGAQELGYRLMGQKKDKEVAMKLFIGINVGMSIMTGITAKRNYDIRNAPNSNNPWR